MINLEDVYFPKHIKIYTFICNILSLINVILCIIILPIILTKTLQSMKVYKRLLIFYILVQMGFDWWSILFKHTILLPLNVIISVGYLKDYANPVFTNIGFVGFLTFIMALADILLCLFIERYYSITKNLIPHKTSKQVYLYLGIGVTNAALFGTSILSFIVFGHLFSSEDAIAFLRETITNPEPLLSQQVPCVTNLYTKVSISTLTTAITFFIYAITRSFGYCYFTYQNIKCLKFAQNISSFAWRRNHAIIIKTLLIQLAMMIIFFGTPACVTFYIVTMKQAYPLLYMYIQCAYHIYPIFDLVVTVAIIKPYRRAIIEFFVTYFSMFFGPKVRISFTSMKSALT